MEIPKKEGGRGEENFSVLELTYYYCKQQFHYKVHFSFCNTITIFEVSPQAKVL